MQHPTLPISPATVRREHQARLRIVALCSVFIPALLAACATGEMRDTGPLPKAGPLLVVEAWARPADSGTTAGAYVTLENADTVAHSITAVSSPDAAGAELHATMQHDGMAHMVAQPVLTIAPDSTLVMAPGGLHVMLHATNRAFIAGDTIRLLFTLDNANVVPVAVAVRVP